MSGEMYGFVDDDVEMLDARGDALPTHARDRMHSAKEEPRWRVGRS